MKYRIREELCGYNSNFYTERWHEPYKQWVAALHCKFDSLRAAQEGLDFYNSSIQSYEESTIIHEYEPKRKLF